VNTVVIIGEPVLHECFGVNPVIENQYEMFERIRQEFNSAELLVRTIREEQVAIATALKDMGYSLYMVHSHPDLVDEVTFEQINTITEGRSFSIPEICSPIYSAFPRDLWGYIGDTPLHNSKVINRRKKGNYGSVLGEGGKVISTGNKMLACLYNRENSTEGAMLRKLRGKGYIIVRIFPLATRRNDQSVPDEEIEMIDHIDLSACIVRAADGSDHLIIDEKSPFVCQGRKGSGKLNEEQQQRTFSAIGAKLEVTVHQVNPIMPYGLNIPQFFDGKVLMTQGEPEVESLLKELMGDENVRTTSVPIRAIPVFRNAGIRCLTNEYRVY